MDDRLRQDWIDAISFSDRTLGPGHAAAHPRGGVGSGRTGAGVCILTDFLRIPASVATTARCLARIQPQQVIDTLKARSWTT
jgi:hypothetical protein